MSFTLRYTDEIASVLLLTLCVAVFLVTAGFPESPTASEPGPAFFPRAIVSAIALLAVVQLGQSFRREGTTSYEITTDAVKKIGTVAIFLAAYVVTMPLFGFFVGTIIFLTAFGRYSGIETTRTAGALAVGSTFVLYYAFVDFLNVPLPRSSILPLSKLLPSLSQFIGVIA